jgi:SAM-dependent methyltransferase
MGLRSRRIFIPAVLAANGLQSSTFCTLRKAIPRQLLWPISPRQAGHLASDTFDFIILTQTLHLIYDVRAALATLHRILKTGGTLLTTVSGLSKISRHDMDRWGHCWGFTTPSAEELFHEFFPMENLKVECHGNVLAAIAFLHGLASEELRPRELDYQDPDFQVLITDRAVKPNAAK